MDTKEKVEQGTPVRRSRPSRKTTNKQPAGLREPSRPLQDVVYVPPKPFMRNRLLLGLATVAAVVLALVLAMAVFFRVEHVQVSGAEQYSAEQIKEASGIQDKSSLFSLNLFHAVAKIQSLDYVKDVRIGIHLPNTVWIEITEVKVTYAIQDQSNVWWRIESGGKIIEKMQTGAEETCTRILGVQIQNPQKGENVKAMEPEAEMDENGNPIPVTVTGAHRLTVALNMATYLEANHILGEAANLDVSDLGSVQFQYGDQYEVKLGNENDLLVKISNAKAYIDKLNEDSHNKGIIDAASVNIEELRYYPDH